MYMYCTRIVQSKNCSGCGCGWGMVLPRAVAVAHEKRDDWERACCIRLFGSGIVDDDALHIYNIHIYTYIYIFYSFIHTYVFDFVMEDVLLVCSSKEISWLKIV